MARGGHADLAALIYFVAEVPGIERIRFTTSHPVEFRDSLVEAYRDVPKLANFLHLPVQSGSDRVLALMKRGHTVLEYKQKLRKLREVRPDISLSTDLIVGFPGETEQDFESTLALVREVGFDQSFSFIYSQRPGHARRRAAGRRDATPKSRRASSGCRRNSTSRLARSAARMVGTRAARAGRTARRGAMRASSRVAPRTVAGSISTGPPTLINRFTDVVVTEAMPNSLRGRLAVVERDAEHRLSVPIEALDIALDGADNSAARQLRRADGTEPAPRRGAPRRRSAPARSPAAGARPARRRSRTPKPC